MSETILGIDANDLTAKEAAEQLRILAEVVEKIAEGRVEIERLCVTVDREIPYVSNAYRYKESETDNRIEGRLFSRMETLTGKDKITNTLFLDKDITTGLVLGETFGEMCRQNLNAMMETTAKWE